jgi:hypothetical protein
MSADVTHLLPEVTRLSSPAAGDAAVMTSLGVDQTRLSSRASAPDLESVTPGVVLADRYRIDALLGRGGMGEVYRAEDLRLGQIVAIKFLPPALARDPDRLALFHSEVRIARQVTHPNVTRVYDIVEIGRRLFLTMELIDGEDLSARLRRDGAFEAKAAVDLVRQICAGLAAIHDRGVLHRDLKPANIMVDRDGRAHLMDFGLAAAEGHGDASSGTPGYMAPEQFTERVASVRSDLFALGLVIFEIVTGARAVHATSVTELVELHTAGRGVQVTEEQWAGIEPSVAGAIRACLARDPAERPASARDVSAMIRTPLLDGKNRGRRIAQQAVPAAGAFIIAVGVSLAGLSAHEYRWWLIASAAAGAVAVASTLRLTLDWKVPYKGHEIHFQNHPFRGERLFIDGVRVATGGVGLHKTLRGTIERGDGAGERITAESVADPREFRVKIFAESFR